MTDVAPPNADQVRAAAAALKAAIDHHLKTVEYRSGENDPAVSQAFDELAVAAEAYDELLYTAYDEVTPFDIPTAMEPVEYAGPEEPTTISVLIRRDYTVTDREAVIEAGRAAYRLETPESDAKDAELAIATTDVAIAALAGAHDPDQFNERAEEFGLEPGDSTLWVVAAESSEPGDWLDTPFDDADPELVIYRYEVTTHYEDDLDDLEEIELIEEDGEDDKR
jgi:hypothetical protein